MNCRLLCLLPLLILADTAPAQESVPGLKVPPGFVVTQYADHTLANDIYCMTIDPKGRIVVSGRGYIKVLVDDDNDGKADRAIDFADTPKDGAMGLYWEKDMLYVTGDGGLRRFYDKDGDGKADGPSELIRKIKTGGEHTAHAVKRGPDGWLYVLCGDGAGIDKSYATLPTSPIKDPIGGCVIRFTPDLKNSEIVAHGFRNAYGMDFNHNGDFYTFDSDNERCLNLPWYEPTRFYQVIDGGFYGWLAPQRATFWRMPPYFLDVVPPVAYLGRGSPTGVVWYGHKQFPEEYQGGFFALDWTFGRINFLSPGPMDQSSFRKPEVRSFLEITGDHGFAPTSALVDPGTGDLYVSVGGRGTRGAVYRIRHRERFAALRTLEPKVETLERRSLDVKYMHAPIHTLQQFLVAKRYPEDQDLAYVSKVVERNWTTHNHVLRFYVTDALRELTHRIPRNEKDEWLKKAQKPSSKLVLAAALTIESPDKSLDLAEELLDPDFHPHIVLGAIRVLQILMGDIGASDTRGTFREGYSLRSPELPKALDHSRRARLIEKMLRLVRLSNEIDRELSRTIALFKTEQLYHLISVDLSESLTDQIHHRMCLAVGNKEAAWLVVNAVLELEGAARKKGIAFESNGPLRLKEMLEVVGKDDPKVYRSAVSRTNFGQPEHIILTQIKGFPRLAAAYAFFERIGEQPSYPIKPDVISLLSELPSKLILPSARKWWTDPSLRPSLLPILAKMPEAEDYPHFVEGLKIGSPALIETSLNALKKLRLQKDTDGSEPYALLRALSVVPEKQAQLRLDLFARLAFVTGLEDASLDVKTWRTWFRKTHPKLAAKLENPDGVDLAAWEKRLAKINWERGDAGRGQKVFAKASCIQCHGGSSSVGPDLAGVTGRFSRADLFTAILQPSKDVADRYRTTQVETKEGKSYQGLVIYDAIDSLILHTREGTTVRILGPEIAERRQIDVSPMPSGLLETLTDEEITDLYAYLRAKK